MPFRPHRFAPVRTRRSQRRRLRFGATGILVLALFGVEVTSAQELPTELAFGLPEPEAQQLTDGAGEGFCPLGVCRPRRRDSVLAGAGFGLAALGSAWLGRHRSRDSQ